MHVAITTHFIMQTVMTKFVAKQKYKLQISYGTEKQITLIWFMCEIKGTQKINFEEFPNCLSGYYSLYFLF